jgi:hypothetical protein
MSRARAVLAAAGFGLLMSLSPALADVVKYSADLSGPGENPPTTSKGVGKIEVTFDTATKILTWSGSYSGLTGPEIAAHFHGPAPVGQNAGVMVPADAKASPFTGSATLTDDEVKALTGGLMYFNIHTLQNKGGEIRGQLEPEK